MADADFNNQHSVQIIRVFLASPGDLKEERRLARAAVSEINRTVARPAGFQVDLIGWEDTLSAAGRPQAIINQDLLTCQMFIGMLWARWGTPPDTEGRFGSGFEEEFSIACEEFEKRGSPSITLFFRDVEEGKLLDPGPELTKVLSFKSKIISEKRVLFETFNEPNELAQKVRLHIADFIHKLQREKIPLEATQSITGHVASANVATDTNKEPDTQGNETDPELRFLETVATAITSADPDRITSGLIARLRNLAAGYGTSSNDDISLGPHDSNLIYLERDAVEVSSREESSLADAGLDAFQTENAPLWTWLSRRQQANPHWLVSTTCFGPLNRRRSAFRAMALLDLQVEPDEVFTIDYLKSCWFGETVPDGVKNSALDYIGQTGADAFLQFAEEEFARNEYATRTSAIRAVIRGKSQTSVSEAARFAVAASFDALDDESAQVVRRGLSELGEGELRAGLEHRFAGIRAQCIRLLDSRNKISEIEARRFFGDSAFEVRQAAVDAYERHFGQLSDDDARNALVVKKNKTAFSTSDYDAEGHGAMEDRRMSRLRALTMDELSLQSDTNPLSRHDFYLAMAASHFRHASERVRADFDDRFRSYWQKYLQDIASGYGDERKGKEMADLFKQHEKFRIRTLMRETMDILGTRSDAEDLPRIRRALDEEAVDPRISDIKFLERWGAFEDILRIDKILRDHRFGLGLGAILDRTVDFSVGARAVLRLAGERFVEIFSLDISASLLSEILKSTSLAKLKNLPSQVIDDLMTNQAEEVRKVSALQILRSVTNKKAKQVLSAYIEPGKHRFYNVVLWLDLAESYEVAEYRSVARRELERMR